MTPKEMGRRAFVQVAGAAVGGLIVAPACATPAGKWRVLTDAEAAAIEAIAEQFVPADQDPGSRDANVVNYIDQQLASVFAAHLDTYRKGIAGVQRTSNLMFGGDFERLPWAQQTDVLRALEQGDEPARSFFSLIRDHTMQGFYGSPRHGGNRRFVSFRMIGLDYPRVVGENR